MKSNVVIVGLSLYPSFMLLTKYHNENTQTLKHGKKIYSNLTITNQLFRDAK